MLVCNLSFDGTLESGDAVTWSLNAATEHLEVAGTPFKSRLQSIDSVLMKAPSRFGGLVQFELGSITVLFDKDDSDLNNLVEVDVILYRANPILDTLITVGEFKGTLKKIGRDSITFMLWERGLDQVTPAEQYYRNIVGDYSTGLGYPIRDLCDLIFVNQTVVYEDRNSFCSSGIPSFADSPVQMYVKKETVGKTALSELLASRCCLGIINGSMPTRSLDIVNLMTGFKNVVHISSGKCKQFLRERAYYKQLRLETDYQCDGEKSANSRAFRTTTTKYLNEFGPEIKIKAFFPYSPERVYAANTYKQFINHEYVEASLTLNYDVNLGDLVVVDDVPDRKFPDHPFTFVVDKIEYGSDIDTYKVGGRASRFYYTEYPPASGTFDWCPNVCSDWQLDGVVFSTTVQGPADGATIENTSKFTLSWDKIDGKVLGAFLSITRTNPVGFEQWFNVCGDRVREEGGIQSVVFEHDFGPGDYSWTASIYGTDISWKTFPGGSRTLTFA